MELFLAVVIVVALQGYVYGRSRGFRKGLERGNEIYRDAFKL